MWRVEFKYKKCRNYRSDPLAGSFIIGVDVKMISKNKKRQFQTLYCLGLLMLVISASMNSVDCGGGAGGGAGGDTGGCTRIENDFYYCSGPTVITSWGGVSEEACSEKCYPNDPCCEAYFCPTENEEDCYRVYNDPGDPPDPVWATTTAVPRGGTYVGAQEVELVVNGDFNPFDGCMLQGSPDDVIETFYWTAESEPGVFELYTTPIIIDQDTELSFWSRFGACEEEYSHTEYYIIDDCPNGSTLCDETWYKDFDNDLYGDMYASSIIQPNRPTDYYLEAELTQTDTDCDDSDAGIYPGAADIFGDGIDQDCDGGDTETFTLPDTGQAPCYALSDSITDCTGTGQDGEYSINVMSYTDNGDGTVTDNVTGLMWQKVDDNTLYNWYEASGTVDATSNPGGVADACGALTTGGHSDWRLPMKKELVSLVHYGLSGPAIYITYFLGTNDNFYWSSTTLAGNASSAWLVDFDHGNVAGRRKTDDLFFVRCVR